MAVSGGFFDAPIQAVGAIRSIQDALDRPGRIGAIVAVQHESGGRMVQVSVEEHARAIDNAHRRSAENRRRTFTAAGLFVVRVRERLARPVDWAMADGSPCGSDVAAPATRRAHIERTHHAGFQAEVERVRGLGRGVGAGATGEAAQ